MGLGTCVRGRSSVSNIRADPILISISWATAVEDIPIWVYIIDGELAADMHECTMAIARSNRHSTEVEEFSVLTVFILI